MSAMKRNLDIVWNNNRPSRYIPRSLDGGTGWGVWDDKEKRFLKDREVRSLSPDNLRETVTN